MSLGAENERVDAGWGSQTCLALRPNCHARTGTGMVTIEDAVGTFPAFLDYK